MTLTGSIQSIGGRLLLLLIVAEAPLGLFGLAVVLQNDQLRGHAGIGALRIAEIAVLCLTELALVAAGASLVVVRPIRRLNDAVQRWQAGEAFDCGDPAHLAAEVLQLTNSFHHATDTLTARELELRGAIAQQELMMQEIHHRVKNNLQIIGSLLNLQANRIKAPEAKAEFQSARDRVRALATLHRHLYADGELHMINMHDFFAELCSQLFLAMGELEGGRIKLDIVAPEMQISSDQAVPLALIVTEIVSNALKFAFPNGRPGAIGIRLEAGEGQRATLSVSDNGIGFGQTDGEERPRGGLGLQLVRGFARQLGASLHVSEELGTCYRVDMTLMRNSKLGDKRPDSQRAVAASA